MSSGWGMGNGGVFCRLKDCRRLATCYDKLSANFLGNIHLAAAIMWWL